jgi:hypothetical protein
MWSTLYRINLAPIILAMLFLASPVLASVGSVTEQVGPAAELKRDKNNIPVEKGTGIEMNDVITTAKTRLGLTFEDDTKVAITEQSKLMIDDFVYDANAKTGKLAMRVALGTVRYASGEVAKSNKENVRLRTPTATISVRGTDFTMTVDEIGRSLVILLPTCPENAKDEAECFTGEIEVATDAGAVILNQAYQATVAASASAAPSQPKIIDIDKGLIDNLLIVSPPSEIRSIVYIDQANDQVNFLDADLLEYQELVKDLLGGEDFFKFSELDTNRLEADYLDDFFAVMRTDLDIDEFEVDPVLPTVKRFAWIQYAYNEETLFLRSERPPHIAEINGTRDLQGTVTLIQDGVTAALPVNDGGTDVVINITQTQ